MNYPWKLFIASLACLISSMISSSIAMVAATNFSEINPVALMTACLVTTLLSLVSSLLLAVRVGDKLEKTNNDKNV